MIRPLKQLDEDFIYHSWIHSVKCPTKAVSSMTRAVIDHAVQNGGVQVFCMPDDPDHIIGWVARGDLEETPLLLYLFVKKDFRKEGIGTELLNAAFPERVLDGETVFSCYWSYHMQKMDARKKWGVKFVSNLLPAHIYTLMSQKDAA